MATKEQKDKQRTYAREYRKTPQWKAYREKYKQTLKKRRQGEKRKLFLSFQKHYLYPEWVKRMKYLKRTFPSVEAKREHFCKWAGHYSKSPRDLHCSCCSGLIVGHQYKGKELENQFFCSRTCLFLIRANLKRVKKNKLKDWKLVKCSYCGEIFARKKNDRRNKIKETFCGHDCLVGWNRNKKNILMKKYKDSTLVEKKLALVEFENFYKSVSWINKGEHTWKNNKQKEL